MLELAVAIAGGLLLRDTVKAVVSAPIPTTRAALYRFAFNQYMNAPEDSLSERLWTLVMKVA